MEQAHRKIASLPLERSARSFGTDELNICEFPLASTGRAASKGETTLVFEDEITDQGAKETVKRKLIVSASEAFGLPTPADSDVLLVLMHLTNIRNSFTDPTVHFTRYELVKFLGWKLNGRAYKRIDESLSRWVNVTLNYNRAWWSRPGKRWESKSFHILESVDLRGKGDYADDGASSFTWSQVILDSFKAQQTKRLDLDTYFRLNLPTAKQAYRFLDKRFYRTRMLEFDLKIFACEHVGLSRNYDIGQLKRKLQPAIEELEGIGFLVPLPVSSRYTKRQRGDWVITLMREGEPEESVAVEPSPVSECLWRDLEKRGVHAATAAELVSEFSEKKIREQIAYHDWLLSKGGKCRPKNPPGFLAASIRGSYSAPVGFGNPRDSAKAPPSLVQKQSPDSSSMTNAEEEKDRALRRHFDLLPFSEQERIEELALQNGNRFLVETYVRRKPDGGKLWVEVRNELVLNYLKSKDGLHNASKDLTPESTAS